MAIDAELTHAEIRIGALWMYYPAGDHMTLVTPIEILTMRAFDSIFALTPSEVQLVRQKAEKLVAVRGKIQ